jgi:ankyrin repeat protein
MRDVDTLRFCLEHGVDPNHKDRVGRTPLHYACGHAAGLSKAFVELLLQFGAVETADQRGATPVDNAIDMNNWETVKILEPLVQNFELRARFVAWWDVI